MVFAVTAEIAGMEQILKRLEGLSEKAANKILKPGTREAAKILSKSAKSYVPVQLGFLKKSLGWKVRVYKQKVIAIVGPRKGFKTTREMRAQTKGGAKKQASGLDRSENIDPVHYAHLVEFVRKELSPDEAKALVIPAVWRGGGMGPSPLGGDVIFRSRAKAYPGHPFLRPAIDSNQGRILQVMTDKVTEGLQSEAENPTSAKGDAGEESGE